MGVPAHLSTTHWWASLLYLLPVLLVAGSIGVTVVRDRRRDDRSDHTERDEDGSAR